MVITIIRKTVFNNNIIPHSRKYWQELNLAVEPKMAIARILVDLKFGSSVRDHHTYICKDEILADLNLAVVIQTAKTALKFSQN